MEKINWSTDSVKMIDDYREKNGVTLEQASKDLKFGMATYYKHKASLKNKSPKTSAKRAYVKKPHVAGPMTMEVVPTKKLSDRVMIIMAHRDQIKGILESL